MPLKLVPPRPGKTPYFYIRGTYLKQPVDKSTGTPSEAVARQILNRIKRQIESGELVVKQVAVPTFLSAALSYIQAGGERRFLGEFDEDAGKWKPGLITHFGETPLPAIDQAAIDAAAVELYPDGTSATRNRQVYTPVSAVLKHAGLDLAIRRPKGWQGSKRVDWLRPEQAFRLFEEARAHDPEFAIFLIFLCYTGARLSDALALPCDLLHLSESFAYFPTTKNEEPRGVHLPPFLVAELANHPRGLERPGQKVFRFRKCGRLYSWLAKAREAAGPDLAFATFHTLCHTWATWMRRYAAVDTRGLVGTGRWKDEKSAARYEHVVVSEESRKADLLPTPERKGAKVHKKSTDLNAELRLRSPKAAG